MGIRCPEVFHTAVKAHMLYLLCGIIQLQSYCQFPFSFNHALYFNHGINVCNISSSSQVSSVIKYRTPWLTILLILSYSFFASSIDSSHKRRTAAFTSFHGKYKYTFLYIMFSQNWNLQLLANFNSYPIFISMDAKSKLQYLFVIKPLIVNLRHKYFLPPCFPFLPTTVTFLNLSIC